MVSGGDVAVLRQRKDGETTESPILRASNTPTALRIVTQEMLEKSATSHDASVDSTYGVQSLPLDICAFPSPADAETTDGVEQDDCRGDKDSLAATRRSTLKATVPTEMRSTEIFDHTSERYMANLSGHLPSPSRSVCRSLASLSLDSQDPLSSLPSSPKSHSNQSLRPSDDESMDGGGGQVMVSNSEGDVDSSSEAQDSALQLIMPSITMPRRRPFTERGKNMGRLKILVAGDTGVGKTSLIKSIVQICEDIVHVDPSPRSPCINQLRRGNSKNKGFDSPNKFKQCITETAASTKAYPPWWSDVEQTKSFRRRRPPGDSVLERNICFIDTPGYGQGMSKMETIESIVQYAKAQFGNSLGSLPENSNVIGLLSGNGGSQVDVVLYLIATGIKQEDIVFLQKLEKITNVVPLIAKSDTMTLDELETMRQSLDHQLRLSNVQRFVLDAESLGSSPYAVCSAASDDCDTMDASLLMSPDYVQPLIASQLEALVCQLFDKDVASCLRYLASSKLVHAQGDSAKSHLAPMFPLYSMFGRPLTEANTMTRAKHQPKKISSTEYIPPHTQADMMDHVRQEEKLVQIRLAKWASDLQQSLQNERDRFEAIARDERAHWLTEKLGESLCDDHSAVIASKQTAERFREVKDRLPTSQAAACTGDPLGLFRLHDILRRRGWFAAQVVGGFGVLGALVMWTARTWGLESDDY